MKMILSILLAIGCLLQAVDAATSTTTLTSTSTQTSLEISTTTRSSITNHASTVLSKESTYSSLPEESSTSISLSGASTSSSTNNDTVSKSYTSDSEFKSSILAAHNFFRGEHNATDLKWNSTSAKFAAKYAKNCTFKHSGHPTGENLAAGYVNVTTAVNVWGLEREDYDFDAPGFSETTGHFTQVVWKATKTVGCGRYACDGSNGTSGYYVVCEYYPAGNVGAEYSTEVGKQVKGDIDQGYGMGGKGSSGKGWIIAIFAGLLCNIIFVVMLIWKLS